VPSQGIKSNTSGKITLEQYYAIILMLKLYVKQVKVAGREWLYSRSQESEAKSYYYGFKSVTV
jgi:hypothetical protein